MKPSSVVICALLICVLRAPLGLGSAEAADKIRLGVLEFQSKAAGVSNRQAQIITDIFTRTLTHSKNIAVYERLELQKIGEEQRLSMSGLVDASTAVEIGKIAGLQYILLGSVTELSEKVSGGGGRLPVSIPRVGSVRVSGGRREANATLDVRVIDVTTSQVRLALSESGHSANSSQGFSIGSLRVAESEFSGLQARAITDAATRLGHELREKLGDEYNHVLSTGDSYTIDAGSTMGVQEGFLYLVYADGKTVRDMSGNVIGVEKTPLAVIKVSETSSAHSVCVLEPPSKGNLIRRGDKIQPITAERAKGIKFASSRPAASD